MTETEKTKIITVRLSKSDLNKVEAVRTLEKVDRSTLIKEFINDGLRDRVAVNWDSEDVKQYMKEK
jgi:metal-responsive CopG/Arc/MetJ family transcriptional regulator